ncbi:MAG: T9SS type A sorting domain-containing protein [bacterium]|nr:T9SS type A sorting domain-containing protein [bacterium]
MRAQKTILFFLILIGMAAWSVRLSAAPGGKAVPAGPAVVDAAVMDVNQIECYIQNNGKFGEDPVTGGDGFFYPAGQRQNSILFTGGLWVLGKVGGDVRTAAACYSTEFQPGVILPDGSPDDPSKAEYRIYTFNKGEAIDPAAIAQGCPAEVLGDKMMFCVFNDMTDHAAVFAGQPIGLEVGLTVFGFNRTGALGNALFFKYRLTNKGRRTLDDAFAAVFMDPDVGNGNDDLVGCDPALGIGYAFNGDNFDDKYGADLPALGVDFFQGPIVDAPGQSAVLPDGTVLAGKEILGMTSFFAYISGAPITGMTDPSLQDRQGGQEAYFFAGGFRSNGEPWINPITGEETPFPFDGDPVLDTGWLMSSFTRPKDMRMGLSTGPFTLAAGESQDVVIGFVVGQGADNLSAITLMKYYDAQIQAVYDRNFEAASAPPAPRVTVAQDDRSLMLGWDPAASEFSDQGYAFEGYNIWQGSSQTGPWTRVATFDVRNRITTIRDDVYLDEFATVSNLPVQFGKDTGLRHHFFVEEDYLTGGPLVNGRTYWFAVTAYAYDPAGVPKTLESAPAGLRAVPQKPVMDTEYRVSMRDTIPAPLVSGVSDGSVIVTVMDPAAVTGHDYEVTFSAVGGADNPLSGRLVWHLTDQTAGRDLLCDQPQASADGDEEGAMVDGLLVKVSDADPTFKAIIETANEQGPLPQDRWDAIGAPFGGDNVWHALSPAGFADRHYISGGGGDGGMSRIARWMDFAIPRDFEIRFTEAGGWAVFMFNDDRIATTPFEIWDIGVNTPDDPSDDVRMIPFLTNSNSETRAAWSISADEDPALGYPASDWIYWMDPIDANGYANFAAVCVATGAGGTYPHATDGSPEGYFVNFHGGLVYPIGRMIVCDYDGNGLPPATGTVIRFLTGKPNNEAVKFAFSTAGYAKEQSAAIARKRMDEINVFPNPYFGTHGDETAESAQFVTFSNLPGECTIRIFTLSGRQFRVLRHDNGTPFERWDLRTENGLPVGSAMYLAVVETAFGKKVLKLGVINRE